MNAPTPDLPLALRATHLTTSASDPIRPSLKLTITHHYQVQSTIISSKTKAPRIDDTVDVVVPIGGKVEIGLHIDDQLLKEGGHENGQVKQRIRNRLAGMLRHNSAILALSSTRPVAQARTDPNVLILTPISSSPTLNPIPHQLVSSGHPYVYLKRLEVRVSWVKTRTGGKRKLERDDDVVDEEGDALLPLMDELDEEAPEGEMESLPLNADNHEEPSQSWLDQQIERALLKLLIGHLLKRYPLIFDGETYRIAPKTTPGPSLFSSLAHIQRLHVRHNITTGPSLSESMARLSLAQQDNLKARVGRVVALPAKKDRRIEAAHKRQKVARESAVDTARDEEEQVEVDLYKVDRDERQGAYLEEVEVSIDRSDKQGHRKAEAKLKRIVGDAVVFLGRKDLIERRKGRRKLGYGRVKLVFPSKDDLDVPIPISDYALSAISPPSETSLVACSPQVSFLEDVDQDPTACVPHVNQEPSYDQYHISSLDERLDFHVDALEDVVMINDDIPEGEETLTLVVDVDENDNDPESDISQLLPPSPSPHLHPVNDLPPPAPIHPPFRQPVIELMVERFDNPKVPEDFAVMGFELEETQVD
ncbi:hypothetical protein L198_05476 [Cryptococcus wingfieldii CBS 7118]|uniref:Uncharacterized protein n=1 Tax=Cryptococcus wingfieldii CBS 7118 TaxID=1295528 RepID=A0A1E3IVP0_9TREE|nr:hypothetical protein L198_05476 [Cryptococcus wingfieldii CBS 7118]ODN92683.1 hypothetical protein L198_05476 [Cryptococcus wingfieldii CBS 7118]